MVQNKHKYFTHQPKKHGRIWTFTSHFPMDQTGSLICTVAHFVRYFTFYRLNDYLEIIVEIILGTTCQKRDCIPTWLLAGTVNEYINCKFAFSCLSEKECVTAGRVRTLKAKPGVLFIGWNDCTQEKPKSICLKHANPEVGAEGIDYTMTTSLVWSSQGLDMQGLLFPVKVKSCLKSVSENDASDRGRNDEDRMRGAQKGKNVDYRRENKESYEYLHRG